MYWQKSPYHFSLLTEFSATFSTCMSSRDVKSQSKNMIDVKRYLILNPQKQEQIIMIICCVNEINFLFPLSVCMHACRNAAIVIRTTASVLEHSNIETFPHTHIQCIECVCCVCGHQLNVCVRVWLPIFICIIIE